MTKKELHEHKKRRESNKLEVPACLFFRIPFQIGASESFIFLAASKPWVADAHEKKRLLKRRSVVAIL